MPRNPKASAIQRGRAAERNYRSAVEALEKNTATRKAAMLACAEAGCTITEIAHLFGTSRSDVHNVVSDLRAA